MTLYEDFCAFCNEVGEELPTGITKDNTDDDNILAFCRMLYALLTYRNEQPCTGYPDSTVGINNIYSKLVKQWYTKKSKVEEEDEPLLITFRYVKGDREKTFNITASFNSVMELTDMLGSVDYDTRIENVRKWILDHGKAIPKSLDVLQIITDNEVLNVTM